MINKIDLTKILDIYSDGAVSGNPGVAGAGVVFIQNSKIIHTISRNIGIGTNNAAELSAILFALQKIDSLKNAKQLFKHRIRLYTDSQYCLGSIKKNWNAKKNIDLIREIKKLVNKFDHLTFHHVRGHSGVWGNEMADAAAVKAKFLNGVNK